MKITVQLRIYLGFLLLLLFSTVMLVVTISGFNDVEESVQLFSEKKVPTLTTSSHLIQTLLLAEVTIQDLSLSKSTDEANELSQRYKEIQEKDHKDLKIITSLVSGNSSLEPILKEVVLLNSDFFKQSDEVIFSLLEKIKLEEQTLKLAREFGDMGDESLSAAYDLEGVSENDDLNSKIEDFVSLVETTVEEANSALNSQIRFEVMNIQSSITSSLSELESTLDTIKDAPEFQDSDSIEYMMETFAAFKANLVGSNNVIDIKIKTLQAQESIVSKIISAKQSGAKARELVEQLISKVNRETVEVQDDTNDSIATGKTISSLLAVTSIVASIIIAIYINRTISQPLNHTVHLLRKTSQGDLTVQFKKFRDDEFSELAEELQNLVNSLRLTINDIAENSNSLASTSEQTSTISNNSFASIQEQNNQIQLINTSVQEMAHTAKSVSQSVHQTLTEVDSANANALEGEKLLEENIQKISQLESKIKQSAGVIEELNGKTNSITTVLNEIRGVAEQTNLLALNAAIEAARAGEQGRGFAVVADEVRTLASRAHDSTAEIQEAIEQLQQGAKLAVENMEQSQQETSVCVQGILNVQTKLESIVSGVEKIKDMSQLIATAAEEQNVSTESQVNNISAIQEVADTASQHAQENLAASEELAKMAETQNDMVRKFTI